MKALYRRSAVRTLIYTLILTTTALCFEARTGWASLAPSGITADGSASVSGRAADMKTIQNALENKAVRGRLKSLGLDEKEIDARLAKLSDEEVHQFASRIDAVQPGGFVVWVLTVVLLVLLIVYLVKRV